jgi:hypothetical protein
MSDRPLQQFAVNVYIDNASLSSGILVPLQDCCRPALAASVKGGGVPASAATACRMLRAGAALAERPGVEQIRWRSAGSSAARAC